MGIGFKLAGRGAFKAILNITANPNAVVHVESDIFSQDKTADNNGSVSFILKKKGTYNVSTNYGGTGSIALNKNGTYTLNVVFSAIVNVQANPGAVVTLTNYNDSTLKFTSAANSTTGIAQITVAKSGTYTIASNNAGAFSAEGNASSVEVSVSGSSQTVQCVKLNMPDGIALTGWGAGSVLIYFTKPSSIWTGVNLRRNTSSAPTTRTSGDNIYTGAGGSYDLDDAHKGLNGYVNTGLTANTTYYYSAFSYLTFDSKTFWATSYRTTSGKAFNATVNIQANPSAKVTLTNSGSTSLTYQATANSTTGIASITVPRAATYTVTSDNGGTATAEGNTNSVSITTNGGTATGQLVKLNIPGSIAAAVYSTNAITGYWTKPSTNWTGCMLRYNTGSAPSSRSVGTQVGTGAGDSIALTNTSTVYGYTKTGLTAGTTYYFSAWGYITINGTNYYCSTYRTANCAAVSYTGTTQTITSSNASWKVPTGWRQMQVFLVGGGGAGGQHGSSSYTRGSGGGGGYTYTSSAFSVVPGTSYSITIGSGGSVGTTAGSTGGSGNPTTFGSYSASGGVGGIGGSTGSSLSGRNGGGNGGSGGGAGNRGLSSRTTQNGGAGGTNGGNGGGPGGSSAYVLGGVGQGTTTRPFGASSGTVYSGGGGGAGLSDGSPGAGGSYGGGTGASNGVMAGSGTTNSGGGGGGGYSTTFTKSGAGAGGSGVVIVKCTG